MADREKEHTWLPATWERLEYSTRFIGERITDKVVLDLGCSAGHQTVFLGACWRPKMIIGVDNFGHEGGAPKCKEEFLRNVQASGCRNVFLDVSGVFALPFQTSSIDVIVCSQAMHHFFVMERDLRQLDPPILEAMVVQLEEWIRVLKPGGSLIIKDCCRYSFLRLLARCGIPKSAARLDFSTKQEAKAWCYLLKKAGFTIENVEYYVPYTLRVLRPLLSKLLFSFWISMTYFIQASVTK
jgi:SAM-dependent methyltransferase